MEFPRRIAVVGSGCAGLAAFYALRSTNCEVHLYEAQARLGGHTNTVRFSRDEKQVMVDTGFMVANSVTYPNFLSFLSHVGVVTADTKMTFGVSEDFGRYEWAGNSVAAIFAQSSNLWSLRHWRMLFDIVRFNHWAIELLDGDNDPSGKRCKQAINVAPGPAKPLHESIDQYLTRNRYCNEFRDRYLLPMTAAIWSTGQDACALDFPIVTLVRFMWNHRLLETVGTRPAWKTIPGGSSQYIKKVIEGVPKTHLHTNSPISTLHVAGNGQIQLQVLESKTDPFDHVVLATHGDEALQIIESTASELEKSILGCFQTTQNEAVLHHDSTLMPIRPQTWAAWNLLTQSSSAPRRTDQKVSLTYDMNLLQHIPRSKYGSIFVSLNPPGVQEDKVHGRWKYSHPSFTSAAVDAQSHLPAIQGIRKIWYAGAWTKYGFHEDGFTSGLEVGLALGGRVPWQFHESRSHQRTKPYHGAAFVLTGLVLALIQRCIRIAMAFLWILQVASSYPEMKRNLA